MVINRHSQVILHNTKESQKQYDEGIHDKNFVRVEILC